MSSLSISSDDDIEEERITEPGTSVGREYKRRGIVNGVKIGGCGSEPGENKRVVLGREIQVRGKWGEKSKRMYVQRT